MHARIDCDGRDDDGTVTISLKNGKGLTAHLTLEGISVVENSTGLEAEDAEHAAGVAWAMAVDEMAMGCRWERLTERAAQSRKDFEAARIRIN